MKIKCRPEDFRVEELASVSPGRSGRFGLYLLEKRGLSTFEAIERLSRRLGRPARSISAGGLKDKYAVTRQHVTIQGRPVPPLRAEGLSLTPLGRVDEPMTGARLDGNRFAIVLRSLDDRGQAELLADRARAAARQGLPNYFDEQRFGSLRAGAGFLARHIIDGNFEQALRIHLALPSRLDAPAQRSRRRLIEERWGQWQHLAAVLPRGPERAIATHLSGKPEDYAGAIAMIEPRLGQLYLFAYQSYIWNDILGGMLAAALPEGALFDVRYAAGRLRFFDRVDDELLRGFSDLAVPLPSRSADYGTSGPLAEAAGAALAAEGMTLERFRTAGVGRLQFRAGERPALLRPGAMKTHPAEPDDVYPGRFKMRLSFQLPPGSYATLVLKFIGRDLLPGSRASHGRGNRRK